MDDKFVADCSDILVRRSSKCSPPVLWLEFVVLDDDLESSESLLGTVGMR